MTLLTTLYGYPNASKKITHYTNVQFSEKFLECMDEQLSKAFESQTGIAIVHMIWLGLDENLSLINTDGYINGLCTHLSLVRGRVDVIATWKSISGKPVDVSAENIDCKDLVFEFDELDVAHCRNLWKPVWSLFTIDAYKKSYQLNFKALGFEASYSFLKCADVQLTKSFVEATGLKINKNICLMVPSASDLKDRPGDPSFYENGLHQGLLLYLSIYAHAFFVTVRWYSKSGKIYTGAETDIDKDDIVFYFEKLDPPAYYKVVYPDKVYFPVPVKHLPFKVRVHSLQRDCTITIKLRQEDVGLLHELENSLKKFIAAFNAQQHQPDDVGKVDANAIVIDNAQALHMECDMRVGGFDFFKKLFKHLSDYKLIEAVEIY